MTDAERKLTEWLAQYSEAEQERILQYAIDHILPNLLARRLHPLRCEACNYEHGHAIGCKNNPVDIALKQRTQAKTDFTERWICLRCKPTKKGYHSLGCPEFEMTRNG